MIEPLHADDPPSPRYNGAPGQRHWVIRQRPDTGERSLGRLWWGLIPHWIKEGAPKVRPINATAERVAVAPMFRQAFARRRCLLPVDNFFEWRKVKGKGPKQAYAVAMKSGEPFALAGIWEGWRHPETDEVVRTFSVITCGANDIVGKIHDRMPVILRPQDYDRWLSPLDPDPRDLLVPFPSEPMMMWAISSLVNRPEYDDPAILEAVPAPEELA